MKRKTYLSMMPPCPGIMSPKSLILNALLNPSKHFGNGILIYFSNRKFLWNLIWVLFNIESMKQLINHPTKLKLNKCGLTSDISDYISQMKKSMERSNARTKYEHKRRHLSYWFIHPISKFNKSALTLEILIIFTRRKESAKRSNARSKDRHEESVDQEGVDCNCLLEKVLKLKINLLIIYM